MRLAPRLRRVMRVALAAATGVAASGCAGRGPLDRDLHRVDGELTASHAPHPRGYEAYARARMALESDPPNLEQAATQIDVAIRYDPFDPHLWTTRAEIHAALGDEREARRSIDEALALRPGYAPAQALKEDLEASGQL